MKKNMYITLGIIAALLLIWTVVSYAFDRSVARPEYTVVEKKDGYEIRQYEPYILAQVDVEGDYDTALNQGFRILADYIFGNNTAKSKISMTSPVTESRSEKLAMTSPVLEQKNGEMRTISFVMPFEYTLETLPNPNNSAIRIVPQKQRTVAVHRFSWFRGADKIEQKKARLREWTNRDGVTTTGTVEYAVYTAPFTAPWMTTQEVLVEVQ